MLPEKGVCSAVVGTVCGWRRDYAAGLEESSTGEVRRLQKFCRHNCWVLAAARKSKRQLSAESAECCRTRDASRRPVVVPCGTWFPVALWQFYIANCYTRIYFTLLYYCFYWLLFIKKNFHWVSVVNLQQMHVYIFHHALNTSLHSLPCEICFTV